MNRAAKRRPFYLTFFEFGGNIFLNKYLACTLKKEKI